MSTVESKHLDDNCLGRFSRDERIGKLVQYQDSDALIYLITSYEDGWYSLLCMHSSCGNADVGDKDAFFESSACDFVVVDNY